MGCAGSSQQLTKSETPGAYPEQAQIHSDPLVTQITDTRVSTTDDPITRGQPAQPSNNPQNKEQPKPYSRTPMTQKTNPSDNFMNDLVIKGSSELPVDNTQTKEPSQPHSEPQMTQITDTKVGTANDPITLGQQAEPASNPQEKKQPQPAPQTGLPVTHITTSSVGATNDPETTHVSTNDPETQGQPVPPSSHLPAEVQPKPQADNNTKPPEAPVQQPASNTLDKPVDKPADQAIDNQQQNGSEKQPRKQYTEDQTDIEVKKVDISKSLLDRYIDLEKQARPLEEKNVLKSFRIKQTHLADLEQTVKQLEAHYKKCMEQTAKEKADVDNMQNPSVKNFFKDKAAFDSTLSKEQEEYVEALNKQEVAKQELDGVTKQRDGVKTEVGAIQVDADKLDAIYKEQDELLASIFNGKYGSQLEYKLESEMDVLLDKRQRISAAKFKWQNGRLLVHHACNQLAVAVRKWPELEKIETGDPQKKYQIATECRNNLIAANQNIVNAQRYLPNITFPYCNGKEMETLTKATNNIYTDMQTADRQKHAFECYSTTHKRSFALVQWMDNVLEKTINKDLKDVTASVNTKEKELRLERLKLIKEKIKEENNEDIDIDLQGFWAVTERDNEMENDVTEQELFEADRVSNAGDVQQSSSEDDPKPMSLEELAPPPDTDDLFGDIAEVKKQHEQDMEEYEKAQELNKARMQQGLEEKLRARRSRRMRQEKMDAGA